MSHKIDTQGQDFQTGLQGRQRVCAVQGFCQGENLAEEWLCRPEHFNPGGWRPPSAAGTQKERHAFSVSFFLASHYNLDISNFGRTVLNLAHRPFRAAPLLRRSSVLPQAKPRRRGGFAALSIKIPKGVAAFGRRNPKRKDILSDVLSFWR